MTSRCELCGEPMPQGEEMFKFHGYSGTCPKPPPKTTDPAPFKREPRYVVFKLKDISAYLDDDDCRAIERIGEDIATARRHDGKLPFNAVVVEQDWPEFDLAWAMIEARMTGKWFAGQMREMLRSMQAGEMTVSRGLELIDMWLAGNYRDDILPPVRDGLDEDETPWDRIDKLTSDLAALKLAAQAVIVRWDSSLWKDLPHTGECIAKLREALK